MNGETDRVRKRKKSAIIAVDVRRFGHAINTDEVFGTHKGQAECAEFVADRRVDVERLFTHRWRLEQAEEAYRLFDTQTTGKAVILPS